MFSLIVGSRIRAEAKTSLAIGWHAANFSRAKTLDDLDKYLNPPTPQERRRGLLDMFKRFRGKQEGGHGGSE